MSDVGTASVSPDNPLRSASTLPFELPPFGDISLEHCREALLSGMAEQRAEVATIVAADEPATFENTVVALERSGRLLSRAEAVFGNLASSVSTPRMREIERELAPLEPPTPMRCASIPPCSRGSTRCTRPGTTPGWTTRR